MISVPFMIVYTFAIVLAMGSIFYFWGRRLRQSIQEENDQLQEEQEFFIRKMMHEVYTPLTAIELNLSPLIREYSHLRNLHLIKSSARILSTVYDDIAFYTKRQQLCYENEWINLDEFIADRVLYFDAMASVKEISIEIEFDFQYSLHISRTELQRIIDNNLSNAIKYTHENGEIIIVTISEEGGVLHLTFKDNGIGMSDDECKNLFTAYYRGNTHHPGLGLGMNIVKEICDKHGISINIESTKGKGSSFSYIFPASMVHQTQIKRS